MQWARATPWAVLQAVPGLPPCGALLARRCPLDGQICNVAQHSLWDFNQFTSDTPRSAAAMWAPLAITAASPVAFTSGSTHNKKPNSHATTRCTATAARQPSSVQEQQEEEQRRQQRVPPVAGLLAAALLLVAPQPQDAHAYNVRLEDVESKTMQAGLRAATEGRLEEAERFFQIYLLNEDPQSASAYSNLGNVHQQQGRVAQAVEDFTKAIELAPEAPVPYLNRSIAKESLGLEAAARGDSSHAQALWRSAVADCDRAIELDPAEFAAWFDRGNIDMRLEDWQAALTDFNTAADLAPGLAGYRLRAATLMYQQDDVAGARRTMQGLVRKYGNYAEAHAALAAVEWSQGEGARAEEQLVRAVERDPRWADMTFIRQNTRWPPRLEAAMERLLAIQGASRQ